MSLRVLLLPHSFFKRDASTRRREADGSFSKVLNHPHNGKFITFSFSPERERPITREGEREDGVEQMAQKTIICHLKQHLIDV